MGYQISFAVGYILWSVIAYFYRDWHQMQVNISYFLRILQCDLLFKCFFVFLKWCVAIIAVPFILIVLLIPESPRWLFATGRDDEGKKVSTLSVQFPTKGLNNDVLSHAIPCQACVKWPTTADERLIYWRLTITNLRQMMTNDVFLIYIVTRRLIQWGVLGRVYKC